MPKPGLFRVIPLFYWEFVDVVKLGRVIFDGFWSWVIEYGSVLEFALLTGNLERSA